MKYIEVYMTAESPQELIDMVRHDVAIWNMYSSDNADRIKQIEQALNEAANKKNWNITRIKMKLKQEGCNIG